MVRRGAADEYRVDTSDLYRLIKSAKDSDKKLLRELNKALKASADAAVQAAKAEVMQPPPAKVGQARYGTRTYKSKNGKVWAKRVILEHSNNSGGRVRTRGTRAGIARGIKASIRNSAKKGTSAIVIKANSKGLPAGSEPMAKAYNKAKPFRHPVFADSRKTSDKWKWAYQRGHPYFGTVILAHREDMLRQIKAAMERFGSSL